MSIRTRFLLAATLMALSATVPETHVVDGGMMPGESGASLSDATPPEPYSFLLFGSGLIGLGLCGRRRRITMNVAGGSK